MAEAIRNGGAIFETPAGAGAATCTHVGARTSRQSVSDERRRGQRVEQPAARDAYGVGGRGRLQSAAAARLGPLRVGSALQIQKQHQAAFLRRAPPRREAAPPGVVAGAASARDGGCEARRRRRFAAAPVAGDASRLARRPRHFGGGGGVRGAGVCVALQGRFLHPADHRQRDAGAVHERLQ